MAVVAVVGVGVVIEVEVRDLVGVLGLYFEDSDHQ